MSKINCDSCDNLRNHAPEFVQNGVTDNICNSLKNNTGLNPSLQVLHENEEDLHDVNDCTIGRMAQEVEAYEVCDWKEFTEKFVTNSYEMNKALICSDAGQWQNIEKIWCWLRNMTTNTQTYTIHAYEDDDPSKPAINGFRIAEGVSMRQPGPGNAPIMVSCHGDRAYVTGALSFSGNMPSSYTNGATVAWNSLEHGSPSLTNANGEGWGKDGNCNTEPLIWEIQFKRCQLGFSDLFGTNRLNQAAFGDFAMNVSLYKKGDWVPPDMSRNYYNSESGYGPGAYKFNPADDDMMLLQVRLQNTRIPLRDVTPRGNIDVVPCPANWEC